MVHVVEVTFGRPHQERGSYKEFLQRYRPKGFVHDENSRDDIFSQAIQLWRDGSNIDFKVTSEHIPKKIKITDLPKKSKLRDGFRILNGLPLIYDPLRNLIEKFDPGIHDFFPVDLTLPAGRGPETTYSVFIIRAQKDTFIPELSRHAGDKFDGTFFRIVGKNASFSSDCQKGAHIWREKRLSGETFFSDELEAAMRSEGIRYYKYWRANVVSQ